MNQNKVWIEEKRHGNGDFIFISTNGFQSTGVEINAEIAKMMIEKLTDYVVKKEAKDEH